MKNTGDPKTLETVNTQTHKLKMKSKNIINDNIDYIANKFPNVITESEKGKTIDFDLLKQELSNDIIEGPKEKYQLTWPGKKETIVRANTSTTKTLRPIKEKSVDFNTTQNIYIEGDNLEALKILQESYLGKIKCIYIDPPYNTGNDFIYKDNFHREGKIELEESGQKDEENNQLIANPDTNGRFHSDWLSMMYSRLKLARNLLSEDGIMAISIDNNENKNILKMCDEIFGEKSNICSVPILSNPRGRQSSTFFAETHEYCNFYAKKIEQCSIEGMDLSEEQKKEYKYEDKIGKYRLLGLRLRGGRATAAESPTLHFPIYYNVKTDTFDIKQMSKDDYEIIPTFEDGTLGTWRWSKEKIVKEKHLLVVKQVKDRYDVFQKDYLTDDKKMKPKSLWEEKDINYDRSKDELKKLGLNKYFDYAKPMYLMKKIIKIISQKDSIILDFFSGSSSTAHTVMQLNAEDNGNRKYIMIQFPQPCDEKSEAYKNGFQTICDIGRERIQRAGKQIKEETKAEKDYGFRVYQVDSSNMKDVYYTPNDLKQAQLNLFESKIKEDRTSDDLLTQVILDLGLTLDRKIEEKKILDNKVYFVSDNLLVACFDKKIKIDTIEEICKIKPLKIVFQEESFHNDNDRINMSEKIRKLSPETEVNVI